MVSNLIANAEHRTAGDDQARQMQHTVGQIAG
jgi:hypothetical protein